MQRCDPEGVANRWLNTVHPRCSYSVYGPLALWHIDGNHKLIRYHALFACLSYSFNMLNGLLQMEVGHPWGS